jgi:cell division protein FtsL
VANFGCSQSQCVHSVIIQDLVSMGTILICVICGLYFHNISLLVNMKYKHSQAAVALSLGQEKNVI